jgi:thiamine-phosphate pyrophosphorylase
VSADALIAGSRSLPAPVLRQQIENTLALGMPDHNPQEAALAVQQAADFMLCSPIWSTPSKQGILQPRGLQALSESCRLGPPVVALGGIETPAQVAQCRAAGVRAVMVLRAAKDRSLLNEMVAAWVAA